MAKRSPNPNLVKIHRSYSVDEIARLLNVHKNTVRAWFKAGLKPIDGQRPTLVHGAELRAFLCKRRDEAKCKCPPGHFYCLRCRAPKAPAGGMADYIVVTATSGNLMGICPTCDGIIRRRIALAKIDAMSVYLDIAVRQDELRIRGRAEACLSCDSTTEPSTA